MNDRLKDALNQIHAEQELKQRTREYLAAKTNSYTKFRFRQPYRLIPVMLCLVLFLAIGGGSLLYFSPTAAISLDINPSLELKINRFNRVIGVDVYNEEGRELAGDLDVTFLDYQDAVLRILENETIAALLSRDNVLAITVTGANEAQRARILSDMEACASGHKNMHCYSADPDELAAAHELGLSYGKYLAYLKLQALIPDISPEEVRNMTMKEIRNLLSSLSDETQEDADTDADADRGHHGQGHRHGQEKP